VSPAIGKAGDVDGHRLQLAIGGKPIPLSKQLKESRRFSLAWAAR
jgi:hypothetical protein